MTPNENKNVMKVLRDSKLGKEMYIHLNEIQHRNKSRYTNIKIIWEKIFTDYFVHFGRHQLK